MLRLQGEERWPGAVLLALVLAPLEEGLLPAPPPSLFLPSFPCPPSSPLLSPLTRSPGELQLSLFRCLLWGQAHTRA